jgi:hypothetical protein
VPSQSARNLGIIFDADLMQSALEHRRRRLALLCNVVPIAQYQSLRLASGLSVANDVTSLMRLDFCYNVAFGFPVVHLRCLQAVQNAAARLIFSLRHTEHINDALMCLH